VSDDAHTGLQVSFPLLVASPGENVLGWRAHQLPDGTLILSSPAGRTYVTTPGSAPLFPSLCHSTGGMPAPETDPPTQYCPERTAMMPKRRRTRAKDRAHPHRHRTPAKPRGPHRPARRALQLHRDRSTPNRRRPTLLAGFARGYSGQGAVTSFSTRNERRENTHDRPRR
jgi:hypothetical protein